MNIWRKIADLLYQTPGKTVGEAVAEATNGANLVDGQQTWQTVPAGKNDIETMKRCCAAELETYAKTGLVPAPYYFERVAILARKRGEFDQEIACCEQYIRVVDEYYRSNNLADTVGVKAGPRYAAIVKRLAKSACVGRERGPE